jgi:hypothetical protein
MLPSTDITIDLPKLPAKPFSIFHKKLHRNLPANCSIKAVGKLGDDPGRRLMQRYKTELYESQYSSLENEFIEFASGENRNSSDNTLPKKKSYSFISSERSRDESPPPRDHSINFRKRRLPKIIAVRAAKEQSINKLNENEANSFSAGTKIELITFYPHKLATLSPK